MDRYRQQQQVLELEGFATTGRGAEMHPDPRLYGSGWGDPYTHPELIPVRECLEASLLELAGRPSRVLEIGCGGGRWTQVVCTTAKPAYCALTVVDDTPFAFDLAKGWLESNNLPTPGEYLLCPDGKLHISESVDLVFSFDTFVHFDRELICSYLGSIARVLKPGGKFLVNFACDFHYPPDGWTRSDRWFEYILTMGGCNETIWHKDISPVIRDCFDGADCYPHIMPHGYGSAFFVLTRR